MPKLFASDPRRLGYVCDDYDLPVRDLLTGICYPNYCIAEANGVKNWDYECDPEIRFPAPTDEAGAAPPPGGFVYGGGDDGGWDGGNTWIGDNGPPWRTRRPGGSYGPWWGPGAGSGGGGSPRTSPPSTPSTSPGPSTPSPGPDSFNRTVSGRPGPGRTLFSGSDTPSTGSGSLLRTGGPITGTIRRGGGLHTNPAGSGPGVSLIDSGGNATLSTTGIHTNPAGSGGGATLLPGSGGSTLATSSSGDMRTYTPVQRRSSAAPLRRTYVAQRQSQRMAPMRTSSMRLTAKPSSSTASHSMRGLGSFALDTPVGALAVFGGALLLGTYFLTR